MQAGEGQPSDQGKAGCCEKPKTACCAQAACPIKGEAECADKTACPIKDQAACADKAACPMAGKVGKQKSAKETAAMAKTLKAKGKATKSNDQASAK